MCTSNQERICLLIKGRTASLVIWRADDGEARRTFLSVCQLLFAKKWGKKNGISRSQDLQGSEIPRVYFYKKGGDGDG